MDLKFFKYTFTNPWLEEEMIMDFGKYIRMPMN